MTFFKYSVLLVKGIKQMSSSTRNTLGSSQQQERVIVQAEVESTQKCHLLVLL